MSWSGYIDVLGTRDAAKISSQELYEYLHKFHAALSGWIEKFDGDCYAFSDGAFFTCEKFENFPPFLTKIRNELFQSSTFFRCSFLPGEIKVESGDGNQFRSGKIFISYQFSGTAPEAYQAESNFKGVGCVIDTRKERNPALQRELKSSRDENKNEIRKKINDEEEKFSNLKSEYLVDTFYVIPNGRKVTAIQSTDLRYSEYEISEKDEKINSSYKNQQRLVDPIISACFSASARSSKIATYYISALVTMIRCCDLTGSNWDSSTGKWIKTPYVFRHIMSDNSLRVLRDIPGFHLVLLCAFDHLYTSKQHSGMTDALEERILRHLLKVSSCFKDLDEIPDFVISSSARHRLIKLKLEDARKVQENKSAKKNK